MFLISRTYLCIRQVPGAQGWASWTVPAGGPSAMASDTAESPTIYVSKPCSAEWLQQACCLMAASKAAPGQFAGTKSVMTWHCQLPSDHFASVSGQSKAFGLSARDHG